MRLSINWQIFLIVCLTTGWFLLSVNSGSAAVPCDSSNAPWNDPCVVGKTRNFTCIKDSMANRADYTRINTIHSQNSYCASDNNADRTAEEIAIAQKCGVQYTCALCPAGEVCAALVDCESAFAAEGYSCVAISAREASDNYECIPYHCPLGRYDPSVGMDKETTCCRLKQEETPVIKDEEVYAEVIEAGDQPEDSSPATIVVPKTPPKAEEPVKQSTINFNLSTCCRSIVRPLSRNASTGEVIDRYTMNDIVQAAINIYECILCIVGALMLIMTVIGAVMLIVSSGSAEKVALGKKIIIGAVVGGIIAFTTYLIIYWTVTALGARFVSPYSAPADSGDLRVDPGSKASITETIK